MNFAFTEEQELLRHTAREFIGRECPMTLVRELAESASGHQPALWKRMAELGWLGLLIPEEYGGAGLGFVDLVVILEEMGRSLLPSPFFANLQGTLALLHAGSDLQRKEILPAVASGERILSFAISEEAGSERPEDLHLRAVRKGSGFRLSGTKLFVPDAENADTLVVAARFGEGAQEIGLFLVERGAPGMDVIPMESLDRTRRIGELRLEATPASALGPEARGWETWQRVRDGALVALSADATGGAGKVLDDSVAYAKERIQFGKPIGIHQAIKHKCADMLVEVESAKAITHYAAWALSEELPEASVTAAMAKARACDAYRECSRQNIQIHGGVGFTWEYDCHLYFKRAKVDEVTYGDPDSQRERVADLLDL